MKTLLIAALFASQAAFADSIAELYPVAENVRGHENTEWSTSYAYHLTDANKNLPRVLLVGDSICQGYQSKVRSKLEGSMNVTCWASSYCVTSPGYLRLLAFYLDEAKYDVIHFNNGLHSCETPVADYEKSYRAALQLIKAKQPKAKLVWASSTPLNTENAAMAEKVVQLNEAARRAADVVGDISENDLFTLMNPLERSAYWADTHHYSNAGYELIASQVVEKVTTVVSRGARPTLAGRRSYASVEAARDAARTMTKPAVVHLAAGTYRLEKPIVLKPENSGGTYVAAAMVAASVESSAMYATSPDGRVKCDFSIEDGRPVADISFCGRHAFRSELGMDFGRVKLTKSVSRTVRSSWKPVWGFKSEYPENYTELELKLVREGWEGREPPA